MGLFPTPSLPLPAGSRRGGRTPEPAQPALRRLSRYLLAHYQKGTRPVRDWRTTTNVAIDLMVYAILGVVSPPSPPLPHGARAASLCPQRGERYLVCSILPARSACLPDADTPHANAMCSSSCRMRRTRC